MDAMESTNGQILDGSSKPVNSTEAVSTTNNAMGSGETATDDLQDKMDIDTPVKTAIEMNTLSAHISVDESVGRTLTTSAISMEKITENATNTISMEKTTENATSTISFEKTTESAIDGTANVDAMAAVEKMSTDAIDEIVNNLKESSNAVEDNKESVPDQNENGTQSNAKEDKKESAPDQNDDGAQKIATDNGVGNDGSIDQKNAVLNDTGVLGFENGLTQQLLVSAKEEASDGSETKPDRSSVSPDVLSKGNEVWGLPDPVKSLVGRKVSKMFGDKSYAGDVKSFDPENEYFRVVYEDGDEEELLISELKPILIPLDNEKTAASKKRSSVDIEENERSSDMPLRKSRRLTEENKKQAEIRETQSMQTPEVTPAKKSKKKKGKKGSTKKSGKSSKSKSGKKKVKSSAKKGVRKINIGTPTSTKSNSKSGSKSTQKSLSKSGEGSGKGKSNQKKSAVKSAGKAVSPKTHTKSSLKTPKPKEVKPKTEKDEETPGSSEDILTRKRRSVYDIDSGDKQEGHKEKKSKSAKDFESPSVIKTTLLGVSDEIYIGKRVQKNFAGKVINGMVIGTEMFYKVVYDDGDEEALSIQEVKSLIDSAAGKSGKKLSASK